MMIALRLKSEVVGALQEPLTRRCIGDFRVAGTRSQRGIATDAITLVGEVRSAGADTPLFVGVRISNRCVEDRVRTLRDLFRVRGIEERLATMDSVNAWRERTEARLNPIAQSEIRTHRRRIGLLVIEVDATQ